MPYDRPTAQEYEKGSTLLEVLLALIMLSVLTTTVLAIFSPTGLWICKARNETTVSNYAFALLEDLRDQRSLLHEANGISPEDLGLNQQYKPGVPAGITTRISMEVMSGFSQLYKVNISLGWSEGNQIREVNMATLIRKD